MASDKCLYWYRGCPWHNSAFPQIRTSSWTLPFCASVYRGSLYLSASNYIWGGYQRQSCCSFSLSQRKSGLTRQWPELTRCLLKICDRPSRWPSSKSDQRKWMPLHSSGVFVCGSHLREKKYNYYSLFAHWHWGGDWWECNGNPQPVRLISTIGVCSCSAMGDVRVLCSQQTVDPHIVVVQYVSMWEGNKWKTARIVHGYQWHSHFLAAQAKTKF